MVDALAVDLESREECLPLLREALSARHSSVLAGSTVSADRLFAWTRALGAWACDGGAPVPVKVHRAYDEDTGHWGDISVRLEAARRDGTSPEVHVVELGPVPMDVFHHCIAYADLPPVIEGQASANLLTSLGRPFLQVLRDEHVIKNGYASPAGWDDAAILAETAARVAQSIHDLLPERWVAKNSTEDVKSHSAGIERIAQFMRDAQDSSTNTAAYFKGLARHFASNRNDKLLMALLGLREVMLAGATMDTK